jgi:hypothetical protein
MSVYARDSKRSPPGVKLDCIVRCLFFCWWKLADVGQYRSIELSLYMPRRHVAGVEVEIHLFLKQDIDGGQGSASRRGSTIR